MAAWRQQLGGHALAHQDEPLKLRRVVVQHVDGGHLVVEAVAKRAERDDCPLALRVWARYIQGAPTIARAVCQAARGARLCIGHQPERLFEVGGV